MAADIYAIAASVQVLKRRLAFLPLPTWRQEIVKALVDATDHDVDGVVASYIAADLLLEVLYRTDSRRTPEMDQLAIQSLRTMPISDVALLGFAGAVSRLLSNHLPDNPVSRAVAFVELNYGRPQLTVASVAVAAGLSQRELRRTFAYHYRTSVHQVLTCVRVHNACELIVRGQKIDSVGYEVGFVSKATFYRAFRRCMCTTPHAYREGSMEIGRHMCCHWYGGHASVGP